MRVAKFGGDCLADPRRLKQARDLVRGDPTIGVIVVAALAEVTDSLIRAARAAERGGGDHLGILEGLRARHLELIRAMLKPRDQASAVTPLQLMINELEDVLHGVELVRECTARTLDLVMSFGERIAAQLFALCLGEAGIRARFHDARELIVTDGSHGAAGVDYAESFSKIRRVLGEPGGEIAVLTGFIAATCDGVTTTLGRNGSDYTASIVAAALGAERIDVWTAAEGVRSASPAHVPRAFVIPRLSYREAMELSYFGARIIHPFALLPAVEKEIPIAVRSLETPTAPGTVISAAPSSSSSPVCGIASVDQVAIINVEGGGMMGVPGMAARIFASMAHAGVNIIMISQASSEQSICLVMRESEADRALESLESELEGEVRDRRIQRFEPVLGCAIIAVIGEGMRGHPGLSGRVFGVMGREGVNVLAIAQGSSERNISFVVAKGDEARALRALHAEFLETAEHSP